MLLIAGDSYASVGESYFWYDNGSSKKVQYQSVHNKHWCEQIASASNMKYDCTAIPGGDIQHTVTVAIDEMQRKKYTHCIFHLTSFDRIMVTGRDNGDSSRLSYLEVLSDPSGYSFKDSGCTTSSLLDKGDTTSDGKIVYDPSDFLNYEKDHFLPLSINRFRMADQMLRLGALIAFCNTNNIKLCIKSIFDVPDLTQLENLFGNFDHFSMVDCSLEHSMVVAHYDVSQHNFITKMFNEQLPDFLRINNSIV